jgi:hypothetical protein
VDSFGCGVIESGCQIINFSCHRLGCVASFDAELILKISEPFGYLVRLLGQGISPLQGLCIIPHENVNVINA